MKKCLRWPPQTNNRTGFTLIELLIVLSLIAIMVFLSGAQATFLNRMIVRAQLEHLYTISYYLQRRALMLHQPQQLTFDVTNHTYAANDKTYRLPAHVRFGTAPGVKGPPSGPATIIANPVTFPEHTMTVHSDGVIQAGAVYLTDTNRQCTYALSCSVSAVSYLRKYQYTNAWHLIS